MYRQKISRYSCSSTRPGRREQRNRCRERIRLRQLLICVVLFLVVFVGNGVFPGRMSEVRDHLQTLLSADTDFRAAFKNLGASLLGNTPLLDEVGEFCIEVFGGTAQVQQSAYPQLDAITREERTFLSTKAKRDMLVEHYLGWSRPLETARSEDPAEPAPASESEAMAVPAVGTVIQAMNYSGTALPENYTMDQLSLGGLEVVTPVLGHLTSPYGYRDHPVNGDYTFHNGVDISGQEGSSIVAFADGKVDYIGENETHGLYLQLDHGNGIKSFYAHCSKLCVSKGQLVAAGEKIAEVGATGVATGPHLHLELKLDGMHLNPAYYVDFLEDQ